MISGIELSESGELFAYSVVEWMNDILHSTTKILSLNDSYYKSIPYHFENGIFNTELTHFVGWGKRNIFCVDVIAEKVIWYSSLENNQMISDAIIEGTNTYILTSNNPILIEKKWIYDNIKIVSKNISGDEKQLFQYDLEATDMKLKSMGETPVIMLDEKEYELSEN